MARTDLNIATTTTQDKKRTTKISYVNPDATNAQLKTLSQAIVALTTDSYNGAERVTTTDVDTSGGGKTTPTLTLAKNSVSWADRDNENIWEGNTDTGYLFNDIVITYNGDGDIYITSDDPNAMKCGIYTYVAQNGDHKFKSTRRTMAYWNGVTFPLTFNICATETDNYTAVSATFTITA